MHLRPYQAADLPAMADILAEASQNGPLMKVIAPHRFEYWRSFRQGGLEFIKGLLLQPGAVGIVAETDERDLLPGKKEAGGEVVGFAMFERAGQSSVAQAWRRVNQTWATRVELYLRSWQQSYSDVFKQRYEFDYPAAQRMFASMSNIWDPSIFAEGWEVTMLFTDPSLHRRGIGSKMLHWVIRQAEDEGVPAWVKASPAGFATYRKAGFRSFKLEYYDALPRDGHGINYLVYEPKGMEGNWYDPAIKKYSTAEEAS